MDGGRIRVNWSREKIVPIGLGCIEGKLQTVPENSVKGMLSAVP